MDQATSTNNPFIYPPPPTKFGVIMPILTRLGRICRNGFEMGFYVVTLHFLFASFSRLLPSFDASGDFALAGRSGTWQINTAAMMITVPAAFLYFVVPIAVRYKECKAEGTFAPANEFRNCWANSAGVRRWSIHALVVATYVMGSYMKSGGEKRVLDPFHAGVLSMGARAMFCVVRWYLLGEEAEYELTLPVDNHRWSAVV
ncbi:hypothetical protein L227DRAFT_650806 [Lentinus tigrinus ALCF2SS1-6]|uniref:Uncharacterized protein n=1 Tax=Lentinus tigrinus ALCF2SS1-6 TaxID=1328759 RepID=A0A5C2SJ03_9APHY|nr:hypothetical protein L227DRAFT_650806 [Lentinus tigrinus ALCF2SS1-6]